MPEHSANDARTMPWTSIQKLVPIRGSSCSKGTSPSASFAFDGLVLKQELVHQARDLVDVDRHRAVQFVLRFRFVLRHRSCGLSHACYLAFPLSLRLILLISSTHWRRSACSSCRTALRG